MSTMFGISVSRIPQVNQTWEVTHSCGHVELTQRWVVLTPDTAPVIATTSEQPCSACMELIPVQQNRWGWRLVK